MATRKKAAKKAAKKTTTATRAPRKAAATSATAPAKPAKRAKQFAYLVSTPTRDEKGVENGRKAEFSGPFSSEKDALDDAGLMSEADSTITLFRAVKQGSVQKTTRFVATK